MEILLCNDDGYYSKGIKALESAFSDTANLTIVAPETNCSGASSSLTIKNPLRIRKFQDNGYYVNGTPCDCIHLAATTICHRRPDLIISGINLGANLGDDVLYSGTVGAAMGGRFIGVPCLAISIVDRKPVYLDTAVEVARNLVEFLIKKPKVPAKTLNINVPDIPFESLKGYSITRLGNRSIPDLFKPDKDLFGENVYWLGPPPPPKDASEGTDFFAIEQNCVSITPLISDFTDHSMNEDLQKWMGDQLI